MTPEQIKIVRPIQISQFCPLIETHFNIAFTTGVLYYMIEQNPNLKIINAKPMESVRADVPFEEIAKHYQKLQKICTDYAIPPSFVFNVDEAGFQE